MSLDWSISKCCDWQELKTDAEWPLTHAVIFECMAVGIGTITADNWREFHTRSLLFRRLIQADPIPPSAIMRRIGLTTNASKETLPKWLKRIYAEAQYRAKLQQDDDDA